MWAFAWIVCVLGTLADGWTTKVGIEKYGLREKNRAARWLQERIGHYGKTAFDLVLVGGMALLLDAHVHRTLACALLLFMGGLQVLAAEDNWKLIKSKRK